MSDQNNYLAVPKEIIPPHYLLSLIWRKVRLQNTVSRYRTQLSQLKNGAYEMESFIAYIKAEVASIDVKIASRRPRHRATPSQERARIMRNIERMKRGLGRVEDYAHQTANKMKDIQWESELILEAIPLVKEDAENWKAEEAAEKI